MKALCMRIILLFFLDTVIPFDVEEIKIWRNLNFNSNFPLIFWFFLYCLISGRFRRTKQDFIDPNGFELTKNKHCFLKNFSMEKIWLQYVLLLFDDKLLLVLLEFRAFQAVLSLHDPQLRSPLSLPITALTHTVFTYYYHCLLLLLSTALGGDLLSIFLIIFFILWM